MRNYPISSRVSHCALVAIFVVAAGLFLISDKGSQLFSKKVEAQITPVIPELPREYIDTTYQLPTGGTTHTVNAGDDLQAAIDAANPGDVIVLEAGATFT